MKYLIIPAVLCLITFLGSVAIYRKAGYPWWLGLFAPAVGVMAFMFFQLAATPVTVLIMFPHLALANWPVYRKVEDCMVWAGTATDKQIVPFLGRAGEFARKANPAAGAAMCRFVMEKYAGTPSARDAEILLGEITTRPA